MSEDKFPEKYVSGELNELLLNKYKIRPVDLFDFERELLNKNLAVLKSEDPSNSVLWNIFITPEKTRKLDSDHDIKVETIAVINEFIDKNNLTLKNISYNDYIVYATKIRNLVREKEVEGNSRNHDWKDLTIRIIVFALRSELYLRSKSRIIETGPLLRRARQTPAKPIQATA